MEQFQGTVVAEMGIAVLVAIELSKTRWLLPIHDPISSKVSRRRADGGDADALIGILRRCQRDIQAHTGAEAGVECVFEAGYDGVWLHRRLAQAGNRVSRYGSGELESGSESLKVDRRARRVKTDRVDAESLLRALQG